ncbi:MAG: hypothetical protein H7A13_00370 [Pseudomonadales bacterium]|nr:hypothetical protein [Pseudomonadales bacterium]
MQRYAATLLAASFGMLFASTTQAALVVTEVAPQTVAGTCLQSMETLWN